MKKTIPISINQTLFYIEEDAYPKLDGYLTAVRAYFASYDDCIEIVQDIETRIREQLIEYSDTDKTERIITRSHIDQLIASMGLPEQFDTDETIDRKNPRSQKTTHTKKFYRDGEQKIIAGVASGIAQYIGIDPIIVRVLFFISIFFGGIGIVIYVVMWIVSKEATSATQKLQMQGDPITLNEVKKIVEEKIEDVRSEKFRSNTRVFLNEVATFIAAFGKSIFKVFSAIIGIALQVISILLAMALLIVLGIVLVNPTISISGMGLALFGSISHYFFAVLLAFIIALIPVLFIHALGNIFLGKRAFPNNTLPSILLAIWVISITIGAVVLFNISNHFVEHNYYIPDPQLIEAPYLTSPQ